MPVSDGPFAGLKRGHYKVLYADPPWSYQTWSHRGQGKGASQHYSCMSLDDICSLPVSELAAPDSALFIWVVQPMLPEAMTVLSSWGFTFKTVAFYWIKMKSTWSADQLSLISGMPPRLGLGYHTRSGAEQCWLATRGKGYDRNERGVEQVVHAPLREHSRKPDEIIKRIDRLVGDVPRLEMFARTGHPGWDCWGNETSKYNRRVSA